MRGAAILTSINSRACVCRYLPTRVRLQIDGVNTNWGKVTLAHITNLVRKRVLGMTTAARNPVGNTHEVRARARVHMFGAPCARVRLGRGHVWRALHTRSALDSDGARLPSGAPTRRCRAPQDIDAVFAILREELIKTDVHTPEELEVCILKALENYSLKVIVKHVDATLNYIDYYDKFIDPNLKGQYNTRPSRTRARARARARRQ